MKILNCAQEMNSSRVRTNKEKHKKTQITDSGKISKDATTIYFDELELYDDDIFLYFHFLHCRSLTYTQKTRFYAVDRSLWT